MHDIVLQTNTLPEPLLRIIRTEQVRVNEANGVINLIPLVENTEDCFLRGLTAGSSLTVDRFLAMTHDETEMS